MHILAKVHIVAGRAGALSLQVVMVAVQEEGKEGEEGGEVFDKHLVALEEEEVRRSHVSHMIMLHNTANQAGVPHFKETRLTFGDPLVKQRLTQLMSIHNDLFWSPGTGGTFA